MQPVVVVDITIENRQVTPIGQQVDVTVGQEVELRVDSDAADEIHVRSEPEQGFEVEAAADQRFTFRVELLGQVEVESHEIEETILQLVVQP